MFFPDRLFEDARQLDVHADDVDVRQDGFKLLCERAIRFEEERHAAFDFPPQGMDEGRMQQRFAACEAHGLMMRFGEQCVDAGGDVFDAQRVCHVFKAAAARMCLDLACRVRAGRVFGVTVAAREVAAFKAHKNLATADILALALDGRKNLNEVFLQQ